MIGYLSGTPLFTPLATLIVVGGVGYAVRLTASTRQSFVGKSTVEVFVYAHIKEDCFDLYGFASEAEKVLFEKLIDVDGVGPKTAQAIMDRGSDAVIGAVRSADVGFFSSVPRVGKKSAQKIIIELKTKLGGTEDLTLSEPEGQEKEALEALVSLGFVEHESRKVLSTLDLATLRLEDAVKQAIKIMTTHV